MSRARRKKRIRKLGAAALFILIGFAVAARLTPSASARIVLAVIALATWIIYWAGLNAPEQEPFEPLERESTVDEARPLTEEERRLQADLNEASRALARCYSRSVWVFALSLAGIGAGFFMMTWEGAPIAMFTLSLMLGGIGLARLQANGNREAKKVEQLLEHAGPPVTGAVIDFIKSSDPGLQGRAYSALARIARSVRPADGPFIQPADRKWFYSQLRPDRALANPLFAESVLAMVEQLGDGSAEPYLQELLVALEPDSKSSRQLLNAAYFALQSIGQAEAQLSARGTLLSASSVLHSEDADMLLRPGQAAPTQPDALLRPLEE